MAAQARFVENPPSFPSKILIPIGHESNSWTEKLNKNFLDQNVQPDLTLNDLSEMIPLGWRQKKLQSLWLWSFFKPILCSTFIMQGMVLL